MIDLTQPLVIFKVGLLILLLLYTVFTFVVYTQVVVMNRIIIQPPIGGLLRALAILQIILAFSLFLVALAIL